MLLFKFLHPGQWVLTHLVAVSRLQGQMSQKKLYTSEFSFNTTSYLYLVCLFHNSSTQSEDDSDNDDDLFVNTNHPPPIEVQDTSSTDSDS